VFADDITIEDDMSVLVRYDNGANMTYHLTAYSVSLSSFFASFPLNHSTHTSPSNNPSLLPIYPPESLPPRVSASLKPLPVPQAPSPSSLSSPLLPPLPPTLCPGLALARLTNSHGKDTGSCSTETKADSN